MIDVLIPSLVERKKLLNRLVTKIEVISKGYPVNIITNIDNREKSIGTKRNELLEEAKSKYSMFVDDDDDLHRDTFKWIFQALEDNDCVSLIGMLTTDGRFPKKFIHSLDYDHYFERDGVYYRPPNHLNPIRREIGMEFKFPENNFGEDTDWAMQIARAKVLKSEGKIENAWYYYNWNSKISTTAKR